MKVGRVIGVALLGFFFLLFVALDLFLFGIIPLDSVLLMVLPVIGLVLGGVLGAVSGKRATPA